MEIPINERSNKYNPVHKKMHELWRSMMGRCYYEKTGSYENYGARGITVNECWHTYDGFLSTIDSVVGYDLDKILLGELQLDKDSLIPNNSEYGQTHAPF